MKKVIHKYWNRLKDPDSLLHAVFRLYQRTAVVGFLSICSTILIIRSVSREIYGLYHMILALTMIGGLLANPLDESIKRYLQEKIPKEHKQILLQLVLLAKIAIAALIILIILIVEATVGISKLLSFSADYPYRIYMFLALGIFSTNLLEFTLEAILYSTFAYKFVLKVQSINKFIFFGGVVALALAGADYFWYLLCNFILNGYLIYRFWKAANLDFKIDLKTLFKFKPVEFREVFHRYVKSYSGPLIVSSGLTYVKSQLPVILIGKYFQLTDAANFQIIQMLITRISKRFGSFLRYITAKFVERMRRNQKIFFQNLNKMAFISYGSRSVLALGLILFSNVVFHVLKIPSNAANWFILSVFCLDFIMVDLINFNKSVIKLDESTVPILKSSIIRVVVEFVLILMVTMHYGAVGAVVTIFCSRSIMTISIIYYASRRPALKYQFSSFLFIVGFFVFLLIYNLGLFAS